jgi:hypothetical protein
MKNDILNDILELLKEKKYISLQEYIKDIDIKELVDNLKEKDLNYLDLHKILLIKDFTFFRKNIIIFSKNSEYVKFIKELYQYIFLLNDSELELKKYNNFFRVKQNTIENIIKYYNKIKEFIYNKFNLHKFNSILNDLSEDNLIKMNQVYAKLGNKYFKHFNIQIISRIEFEYLPNNEKKEKIVYWVQNILKSLNLIELTIKKFLINKNNITNLIKL